MNVQEIFERIKHKIADMLEIEEDKIKLDSLLREDLMLDSLDRYELSYVVECEFLIDVEESKFQEFDTFRQMCEYIQELEKNQ